MYLVFSGETGKSNGGWADYEGQFDTLEAAQAHGDAQRDAEPQPDKRWYHVVDVSVGTSGEIVLEVGDRG